MLARVAMSRSLMVLLSFTAGCGWSENDMRKYAIKRPSDDDDAPARNSTQQPAPSTTAPSRVADAPPLEPAPPAPLTAAVAAPPLASTETSTAISGETRSLSDTRAPDPTLSLVQRRQLSIENMKRIVDALEAYRADKGVYPPFAIHSAARQPLLSWRVELLPLLGYEPLYQQFHLNEAWDSPHNQSLLSQIPAVYQSPDRWDANTNYQVPIGGTAAFSGSTGKQPRRWEDGLENVVLLVEVDDSASVPWTAPQDWSFNAARPSAHLGNLRTDGFFAGFGGATLVLVPRETPPHHVRAMFTIDGGESFSPKAICRAATADATGPTTVQPDGPAVGAVAGAANASHVPSANQVALIHSPAAGSSLPPAEIAIFSEQARRALAAGLTAERTKLALGAYLMDEPTAGIQFQWIPALRRPAAIVRFGLGMDYTGPESASVRKQLARSDGDSQQLPAKFSSVAGDLADRLLDRLQSIELDAAVLPSADQPTGRTRQAATRVPLVPLGVADQRTMLRAAQQADIDVVLIFQVEEKLTRSGSRSKSVEFSVWDTWNAREVFRTPAMNYLRIENQSNDPLFHDPIAQADKRFGEFLENQLRAEPLPESLKPQLAARRVDRILKLRRDNLLPLLAEIKFYRQQGLIDVQQQLAAYQTLLGMTEGTELLAGSAIERGRILDRWMPEITPQMAETTRQRVAPREADE